VKTTAAPLSRISNVGPYFFDDLKQAYRYPSFKAYTGKGVNIGVLMSGAFNLSDMDLYFGHEKLATPHFKEVDIAGGTPFDPDNSVESHIDLQQTGGMAPGADLTLYNIVDLSDESILAGLAIIVESNAVDVVNMSFGTPELMYTAPYNNGVDQTVLIGMYDDLFRQGNAQGITFVASSGDSRASPFLRPHALTLQPRKDAEAFCFP
jgi:subtilase family serine protease